MVVCPACSAQASDSLRFCPQCGGALGSPKPKSESSKAFRTMVAMRAFDAADGFRDELGSALPGWTAELSTPGMSTGGGRQAIESIVLSAEGGRTVVAGKVDFGARRAELRPHAHVRDAYKDRYGIALFVTPAEYDAFLGRVADFFKGQGFALSVRAGERSVPPPNPEGPSSSSTWPLFVVGLVALVGLGAVFWYFVLREPVPVPTVPNVWTDWPQSAAPR